MDWKQLAKKIAEEGDLNLFTYKGFICLIIRRGDNSLDRNKNYEEISQGKLFHLCGYVGIPEGHILFNVNDLGDLPIECHGGITFCGFHCNINLPQNIRWLGFDCAHVHDLVMRGFIKNGAFSGDTYRDLEYVYNEVKSIVDQITSAEFEVKWKTRNL